ncbi:MAG: ABC transporter substrate-binding protein [Planctomycetes bacterium]|nr:ABC transporter substrate-binding protein [Planctomycetota bacterium]
MLTDLAVDDRIVGVGAYDPVAPAGVALVGDLYRIDYEKLLALDPTDIIVQINNPDLPGKAIPAKLVDLAADHHWKLHQFRIESADDALNVLSSPTGECVGTIIDAPDRAAALAGHVHERLEKLALVTALEDQPRVLLVVATSPLTCVGRGTFLNRLLEWAGGQNVLADSDGLYPVIDREKLTALNPDVIVLFLPSQGNAAIASHAGATEGANLLTLPASMHAKQIVIDDPRALLPSSSMGRTALELAEHLHPGLADQLQKMRQLGNAS